jgi:hypothetical protein
MALQMIAMQQDSEGDEEKKFFADAYLGLFGDKPNLKRPATDDPPMEDDLSRADVRAQAVVKEHVKEYLKKTIVPPEEEES